MRFDIHVHHHADQALLDALHRLEQKLMTTQAELAAQLQALAAQAEKSRGEVVAAVGALNSRVAELEQALANAGQVSPEVEAAFAAVKNAVQAVDDLNPDAPAA